MTRTAIFAAAALALSLSACGPLGEDDSIDAPLGNFRLGHNIVVEEDPEIAPLSRQAEPGAWKEAVTEELAARLSDYDGDKWYHVAVRIEGYMLAPPGVPVVASPKSALIVTASVWDDATGQRINEEPEQFTVLESLSAETVFGSGLTKNKERQISDLSKNAARLIHDWMLANSEWFSEDGPAAALPATTEEGAAPASGAGPQPQPRPSQG